MKQILLIAHRGASAYAPENSLEAFEKAMQMNAKAIECDVRLSKDRKIVVIHDETIDRTTKRKGKVSDYNAEELKKFNIPELHEVLDLIKEKDILLLIEIKESGTEKQVLNIIKENRFENRVVLVSFHPEVLEKVKKLSAVRTGFIFSRIEKQSPVEIALKIKADWILPRRSLLDKEIIYEARDEGLKVYVWTIDDKEEAKKAIELGVDGIASNKPDLLD
jgi:glycerophosphoryl diester phosphodiesterase